MEGMIGFVIWVLCGCLFIGIGLYAHVSRKEMGIGFWANAERFPVKDRKKYNHAVGRIFIVYGAVFILLGLPLIDRKNAGLILISLVGTMVETIIVMVVYTVIIERKYRKW